MKSTLLVLLSVILQAQCRPLTSLNLKERNKTDLSDERSRRVHRIADEELLRVSLPEDSSISSISSNSSVERINVDATTEPESQLSRDVESVVTELSRDDPDEMKRHLNVKANEITEAQKKPVLKSVNSLRDLDTPEELDIYYQDLRSKEKHVKSRFEVDTKTFSTARVDSTNTDELTMLKRAALYFDEILQMIDIQSRISHVRNYFDKFCRKYRTVAVKTESNDF